MRKARQKNGWRRRDVNDGACIKEKENEKEMESSTAKTVGQRNIFAKGISWGTVERTLTRR